MIQWLPNPACLPVGRAFDLTGPHGFYKHDYAAMFKDIHRGYYCHNGQELPVTDQVRNSLYREFIATDLFFILQFVMEVPPTVDYPEFGITAWPFCNSPWAVARCREVEEGPDGWTMDLWARGFFKSTVKTIARTIQRMAVYPDKCTMIASHTRPAAKKFLRSVMQCTEKSQILKDAYPDVFWADPRKESPKWSEDDGIIVKRGSVGRVESTVEAWGLKDGMPIGVHFDWILADDLETKKDVLNPKVTMEVRETFDLVEDLLTGGGSLDITGTPYSHEGVYIPFIENKMRATGKKAFYFRRHPATEDGTTSGKTLFLPKAVLDDIRARKGEYSFNTQQLINPTPVGSRKLDSCMLVRYRKEDVPRSLFKFIIIDPAGDMETLANSEDSDPWAMICVGVEPVKDDLGASKAIILDAMIEVMRSENAPTNIASFYARNGLIHQLGIEITGQFSFYHIKQVLEQAHHIWLNEDMGNLVYLKPHGRAKETRIGDSLAFPLYQGKIGYLDTIPERYMDIIRAELDHFPFYHPNAIDALSYLYADMLADFDFMFLGQDKQNKVVQMNKYEPLRHGMNEYDPLRVTG